MNCQGIEVALLEFALPHIAVDEFAFVELDFMESATFEDAVFEMAVRKSNLEQFHVCDGNVPERHALYCHARTAPFRPSKEHIRDFVARRQARHSISFIVSGGGAIQSEKVAEHVKFMGRLRGQCLETLSKGGPLRCSTRFTPSKQ